ncbi:MAG: glycosyltransferase, partial [Bacteroidaceae bacterium]|nr:glycosyltransferase [Bacteroidaceae bacterium]
IPAYNAAPYLKECLDSIYRLDMQGRGYEVIVVNDGSTDSTAEFLQRYAQGHAEMVVITQENRGLSAARNAGMQVAKGEYLCFMDADDHLFAARVPIKMLETQQADIFSVNVLQTDLAGKRKPYRRYVPPYEQLMSARQFMQGRNLMPCVWSYLWRTAFLREAQLSFVEGMYHEDEDFTPRAFAMAQTFMALNVDWYERILHAESITMTTDKERQQKKLRDMVVALRHVEALAQTDAALRVYLQYKLDYLAVDTLRVLLRQHHSWVFKCEIVADLKALGYFPLRWHWEWKYFLFNLYTRMVL